MSLNETDYELLSAYIDEMLEDDERSALEARLQREPDLRQALTALRQTVALVKGLPALRAPRDFTLTAEMVGQTVSKPQPRIIFMPLLSAAAAVMLMVVGVVLLTESGQGDMAASMNQIAAAPTVTAAQTFDAADATIGTTNIPEPQATVTTADDAALAEPETFAGTAEEAAAEALPPVDEDQADLAVQSDEAVQAGEGEAEEETVESAEQEAPAELPQEETMPEGDAPPVMMLTVPEIAGTPQPPGEIARSSIVSPPQAAAAAPPGTATMPQAGSAAAAEPAGGLPMTMVFATEQAPGITQPPATPTASPTPQPTQTVVPDTVTPDAGDDLPQLPLLLIGGGGVLLILSGLWWWMRRS